MLISKPLSSLQYSKYHTIFAFTEDFKVITLHYMLRCWNFMLVIVFLCCVCFIYFTYKNTKVIQVNAISPFFITLVAKLSIKSSSSLPHQNWWCYHNRSAILFQSCAILVLFHLCSCETLGFLFKCCKI